MTSYHEELSELMSVVPKTKISTSHGNVLPSSVHPSLRILDPFANTSQVFIAPFVQIFLACIVWSGYALAFLVYFGFSTYHLFCDALLFSLTAWRTEMITAPQPGARTSRREFASSKTVSMEDVRMCQRAFSGNEPGGRENKKKHVTVNDVMCSVMSDVLGEEVQNKKPDKTFRGKLKQALNKVLPSPIAFFM